MRTMDEHTRITLFERLKVQRPNPTTELAFHSPFELLIAVLLSAQSTDVSVNKATKKLFAIANTPESILAMGETFLKQHIRTIGLFNSKAKHIMLTCQTLVDKYQSQVPNNREALESLPGVGRKTANVVLNTAFDQLTMAVDTHIFRVANRLGLAKGKTPRQVEDQLLKSIPKPYLKDAHHWLILHGRYTCKARKPLCNECILNDLCHFTSKEGLG